MTLGFEQDIAHMIGFLAGVVVYTVLLAMVLERRSLARVIGESEGERWYRRIHLPLWIAVLGLVWNVTSLAVLLAGNRMGAASAVVVLVATSALGSLPAVAMHSVWQTAGAGTHRRVGALTALGYGLSAAALAMNAYAVWSGSPAPAEMSWRLLTWGFPVLFAVLLGVTSRTWQGHDGLTVVFLAVCSVIALPISHHPYSGIPWWLDLLGHYASVPVAVAVLYRDYRFAVADRFIKRSVSFLLLVGLSCGLYIVAILPWLARGQGETISPVVSGLIIILWVVTALSYSWLDRQVTRAFDTHVLHRPDYEDLRRRFVRHLDECATQEAVLGAMCQDLQQAIRSREVRWDLARGLSSIPPCLPGRQPGRNEEHAPKPEPRWAVPTAEGSVTIVVPTLELPRYSVTIASRSDGHRFLSEDLMLIDTVALIAARRIDALRTHHERCEIALREQELQKLATEAELRALRAQLNPHFLFNALNTIGYLIDTAPERATGTLRDLTRLLRGVLQRTNGGFTTLGEEIELIRLYLEIERARFEERLAVRIEVPDDLHHMRMPALVLQPIVENAVKHGIQPSLHGGEIRLVARRLPDVRPHGATGLAGEQLSIEIHDTGIGTTTEALHSGRRLGIGLANVEKRLWYHYGPQASVQIVSEPGSGTTVTVRLPMDGTAILRLEPIAAVASSGRG